MDVCASVCRLHDAAQRLGSPRQCLCDVVLELQLVAAPFRSNNNRQNVAARNSRCQALATRERFGYCDASIMIAADRAPPASSYQPLNLATVNVRQLERNSRINSVPSAGGPCQLTIVGD